MQFLSAGEHGNHPGHAGHHHHHHHHGHHHHQALLHHLAQPLALNQMHGVHPAYRQLATIEPENTIEEDLESVRSDESEQSESGETRKQRRLAELKTTVFDTYAICAALLASFACSTTFISESELLEEVYWRRYIIQTQQFLVRICIIGGIHAMLVFMFCALYAKSALARENYGLEVYERFSKETGAIRQMAFWSMYYTAILYSFQIAMSTVYSLPWNIGLPVTIFMLVLIGRVVWDAQSIIKAAGCVFMSEEAIIAVCAANKLAEEQAKAQKLQDQQEIELKALEGAKGSCRDLHSPKGGAPKG